MILYSKWIRQRAVFCSHVDFNRLVVYLKSFLVHNLELTLIDFGPFLDGSFISGRNFGSAYNFQNILKHSRFVLFLFLLEVYLKSVKPFTRTDNSWYITCKNRKSKNGSARNIIGKVEPKLNNTECPSSEISHREKWHT
jgi:hypothetical protein